MAQLKPTQATQVTERVSDASACVRGVALQSVKSTHLLRCWAGEASTRGCATVCDSAALRGTQPRHCSRVQPAAAARERHRQHRKRPLVTCGPWVSRLVSHVRLEFRAGACTSLHGPTSDPPERGRTRAQNFCCEAARSGGSYVWNRQKVLGVILHHPCHSRLILPLSLDSHMFAGHLPTPGKMLLIHLCQWTRCYTRRLRNKGAEHPHATAAPCRTLSGTRIMDPCGPDAGQERGCARPISILAESVGAAYSLEALRSTSGRPAGLAPEPAPKRSAPRDEVAPPRASAALGSLATTASPCAPRPLGSLTIGASRPMAFLSEPAFRRQSSPVDALRRLSPPVAAEFANPAPPRAMPPPHVRAFAAPPAPRITCTMRQPRPVARPENGVPGSDAPTPARAPEAVLNAVSAQLSSAARAVSAATPVLTRQWRHFPRRGDDP